VASALHAPPRARRVRLLSCVCRAVLPRDAAGRMAALRRTARSWGATPCMVSCPARRACATAARAHTHSVRCGLFVWANGQAPAGLRLPALSCLPAAAHSANPAHNAPQRNATQRNAPQRTATQRTPPHNAHGRTPCRATPPHAGKWMAYDSNSDPWLRPDLRSYRREVCAGAAGVWQTGARRRRGWGGGGGQRGAPSWWRVCVFDRGKHSCVCHSQGQGQALEGVSQSSRVALTRLCHPHRRGTPPLPPPHTHPHAHRSTTSCCSGWRRAAAQRMPSMACTRGVWARGTCSRCTPSQKTHAEVRQQLARRRCWGRATWGGGGGLCETGTAGGLCRAFCSGRFCFSPPPSAGSAAADIPGSAAAAARHTHQVLETRTSRRASWSTTGVSTACAETCACACACTLHRPACLSASVCLALRQPYWQRGHSSSSSRSLKQEEVGRRMAGRQQCCCSAAHTGGVT
jgi:hypothetical protein